MNEPFDLAPPLRGTSRLLSLGGRLEVIDAMEVIRGSDPTAEIRALDLPFPCLTQITGVPSLLQASRTVKRICLHRHDCGSPSAITILIHTIYHCASLSRTRHAYLADFVRGLPSGILEGARSGLVRCGCRPLMIAQGNI